MREPSVQGYIETIQPGWKAIAVKNSLGWKLGVLLGESDEIRTRMRNVHKNH